MIHNIQFTVADFETTGHSFASGGRIMQAAFVQITNGKIARRYHTYLNPGCPIPPFIQELTGIRDHDVNTAPLFHEQADVFHDLLAESVFVAHNVQFDLSFLNETFTEQGLPLFQGRFIDTVELAKVMLPAAESYKLGDLSEQLDFTHSQKHRADSDAYATAELFLWLVKKLEALPLVTLEQLLRLSEGLKSDISYLISTIIMDKKTRIETLPPEWTVYRGIALRKKARPVRRQPDPSCEMPASEADKWALLSGVPGMEQRSGQMAMMETAASFFTTGRHTVIEAGTGTGKSLAYLIPAVFKSRQTGKPAVVSTYTILLQHQLLEREVATLQRILPFPVQAVVLKGKRHYLDLSRFARSLREKEQNYDRIVTKMQLLVWLLETKTGDGDELNLSSGGALYWQEICQAEGEPEETKAKKAWRAHDFARYAKKVAASADIIITNHSFLIADMRAAEPLLDPGSFIVIDEAHRFEKAARDRLGKELSLSGCKFLLGKLGGPDDRRLLAQLSRISEKRLNAPVSSRLFSAVESVQSEAEEWFGALGSFFEQQTARHLHSKRQLALTDTEKQTAGFQAIEYGAERFYSELTGLNRLLEQTTASLAAERDQLSARDELIVEDMLQLIQRLRLVSDNVFTILFRPDDEEVVWVEGDVKSIQNTITLRTQPVEPGRLIRRYLLERHSVMFTSATLAVKRSFAFFADQMGLDDYDAAHIPSPFSYETQCRVVIPEDVPDVKETDVDTYAEAVANYVIAAAEAAEGRMLVLFTSFEMLKKTHDFIRETALLDDYAILAQGITGGSVARLAKQFRQYDKAVLLGTGALWEGLDVPGEDLSVLFIVKLPFAPPDDPFVTAKKNQLELRGVSSFTDYALPQAIIRFRQGFGRLIRTKTDRGIAVIFDRRVLTSSYGKAFLDSIPPVPIEETDISGTVDCIEQWLLAKK